MSPWKRAGKAFVFGSFVGAASFYQGNRNNPGLSSSDRMLLAGILGVFCGLVAFTVAGIYYTSKWGKGVAVQPSTTKARNRNSGLVWIAIGIIGFIAILLLIGTNYETETAQKKPNNTADAEAQAAAQFEKDFYEKYPDLKPYGSVVDAVAHKLQAGGYMKLKASGYEGESREAVMEMLAKAARTEILAERGDSASGNGSEQSAAPLVRAPPVNIRAGDVDLYDSGGRAVAYVAGDDNLTVYLWSGKPCAYLDDADIYGFNGKHLGWFQSGLVYDNDGYVVAGVADAFRSGAALPPLKGLKQLIPLKSLKELKPLKPPFYNQWSGTPAELFFLQGA